MRLLQTRKRYLAKRTGSASRASGTALFLLLAAALAAAGCGSSAPSSSSTGPITVSYILDLSNESGAMQPFLQVARGSVRQINAAGGIDGRTLKLDVCDAAASASTAASCAQKAVAAHLPAVFNGSFENTVDPILQANGIADLGNGLSVPSQYTSSTSFPLGAGGTGNIGGMGSDAVSLGCHKIAFLGSFPTGLLAVLPQDYGLFKQVASAHKVKVLPLVEIPYSTGDFTSYVAAQVQKGVDCIGVEGTLSAEVGMIRAARQEAPKVKIITATGLVDPATIQSLGALLNNVYAVDIGLPNTSAESNPAVANFVSTVKKYSAVQDFRVQSEYIWAGLQMFVHLAKSVHPIDSHTILAAAQKLTNYDSGVFPVVSYNKPAKKTLGPRVFTPDVVFGKYESGKFVTTSKGFVNIYTLKPVG